MVLYALGILVVAFIQFRSYRKQKQASRTDIVVLSILYTCSLCIAIIDLLHRGSPATTMISYFQPINDWIYRALSG